MLGPVRNDVSYIRIVASEVSYKDSGRCNAVAVVISVDKNPSVQIDCLVDDINGLLHVIVKERIVPESAVICQKLLYGLPLGYTAILEQNIKERISIRNRLRCR